MIRHVVRLALGGILAGAMLAVGAPAANAAPVPETAAAAVAGCKANPIRPVKVGSSIRGATTFSRCNGRASLSLQRQKFPGWWTTVKVVGVPASGRPTVTMSCRGSGTRTYRTLVSGFSGGRQRIWTSATYRVHC